MDGIIFGSIFSVLTLVYLVDFCRGVFFLIFELLVLCLLLIYNSGGKRFRVSRKKMERNLEFLGIVKIIRSKRISR